MDNMHLILILIVSLLLSCGSSSTVNTQGQTAIERADNNSFNTFIDTFASISLPYEVKDSTLSLSTYVEIDGFLPIEKEFVQNFLSKANKNHKYYYVGKLLCEGFVVIIYLESYYPEINGKIKDIYKIATFRFDGSMISTSDIGLIETEFDGENDSYIYETAVIYTEEKTIFVDTTTKRETIDFSEDTSKIKQIATDHFVISDNGTIHEK